MYDSLCDISGIAYKVKTCDDDLTGVSIVSQQSKK